MRGPAWLRTRALRQDADRTQVGTSARRNVGKDSVRLRGGSSERRRVRRRCNSVCESRRTRAAGEAGPGAIELRGSTRSSGDEAVTRNKDSTSRGE